MYGTIFVLDCAACAVFALMRLCPVRRTKAQLTQIQTQHGGENLGATLRPRRQTKFCHLVLPPTRRLANERRLHAAQ